MIAILCKWLELYYKLLNMFSWVLYNNCPPPHTPQHLPPSLSPVKPTVIQTDMFVNSIGPVNAINMVSGLCEVCQTPAELRCGHFLSVSQSDFTLISLWFSDVGVYTGLCVQWWNWVWESQGLKVCLRALYTEHSGCLCLLDLLHVWIDFIYWLTPDWLRLDFHHLLGSLLTRRRAGIKLPGINSVRRPRCSLAVAIIRLHAALREEQICSGFYFSVYITGGVSTLITSSFNMKVFCININEIWTFHWQKFSLNTNIRFMWSLDVYRFKMFHFKNIIIKNNAVNRIKEYLQPLVQLRCCVFFYPGSWYQLKCSSSD